MATHPDVSDGPRRAEIDDRANAPADTDDDGSSSLSPKVLVLWRAGGAIVALIVTVGAALVGSLATAWPTLVRLALPVVVGSLAVAAVVILPSAAYRRWRYRVTEDGIELRHGIVVHHQSSVPHFRVQHVDVRRGVLQRQLGIVSLTVSTASPATDAELPGLAPDRAEAIRRHILDRAEADDGV